MDTAFLSWKLIVSRLRFGEARLGLVRAKFRASTTACWRKILNQFCNGILYNVLGNKAKEAFEVVDDNIPLTHEASSKDLFELIER